MVSLSSLLLHQLSGRDDQLMIDPDILVQQVLQLLVLVVQLASLVYQLLPRLQ
jgi:hypothetical protein